jgi:regulator of cell morphogenesis and NO signaling
MKDLTTKTIRDIALDSPVTTVIFEEFKIDYCCGGQTLFLDACRDAGADPVEVLQKIDDALTTPLGSDPSVAFETLAELVDQIEEKHHTFTKYEVEHLPPLMEKVAGVHGEDHPELVELLAAFQSLCDDLHPHMQKEEVVLFPYIRQLERSELEDTVAPMPCFGTVQNPVRMMMMEHETAGENLRRMRGLSCDYTVPEGACSSYIALYGRLEALEHDLHQHIHLENNILFPKAIELEQRVFSIAAPH